MGDQRDGRVVTARMFFGRASGPPLSVSLNLGTASGWFINSPPGLTPSTRVIATTPATVATPAGGIAGYTYSWARISGSTAINTNFPTSASTTFSGTVGVNQTLTATFRVTVTDSLGATATADVAVDLFYDSGL